MSESGIKHHMIIALLHARTDLSKVVSKPRPAVHHVSVNGPSSSIQPFD